MNTSSSESSRRGERKRSRSRQLSYSVRRFWQAWRVEILIAFLFLLAIFLLLERMNIRQTLYSRLVSLLEGLNNLGINLIQGLANFARGTTLSDLLAYLLLILVLGLALWRTRQRLTTQPRFTELECPQCGADLSRIHRRRRDRALSLFVPVRRYQCKNRECRWSGLRIRRALRR